MINEQDEHINQSLIQCIILQEEQTQYTQVLNVRVQIENQTQLIDLKDIFCQHIKNYKTYKYRVYDQLTNEYIYFQNLTNNRFKIKKSILKQENNIILVKYKRLTFQEAINMKERKSQCSDKEIFQQTYSYKKQRSKERVIYEVIQLVKKWRDMHTILNKTKKVSLEETAKMMGLSKKSLDDYYYQLRLGEKYGFEFKDNFYEKIGILRTYLKSRNSHLKEKKSSSKHCKGLQVLDQFEEIQQSISSRPRSILSYSQSKCIYEQDNERQKNKKTQLRLQRQKQQILQMNKNVQLLGLQEQWEFQQMDNNSNLTDQREEKQKRKLYNQFYQNFGFECSGQDPFLSLDKRIKEDKNINQNGNIINRDDIFFEQQQFF